MKETSWIAWAALSLLTGCFLAPKPSIDPSGAYPDLGTGNVSPAPEGRLLIRTLTFESPVKDESITWWLHSGFTIFDASGRRVKYVQNHMGPFDESPQAVALEPGRYLIELDQPRKHPKVFWVTIKDGELSEIDVEKLAHKTG